MATQVATTASSSCIRVVCQSVLSASLLVDNVQRRVSIGQGVIFYVSFIGPSISEVDVDNSVGALLNGNVFVLEPPPPATAVPLSPLPTAEVQPSASPTTAPAPPRVKASSILSKTDIDCLIIPQATLAGRLKGKAVQYHDQCPKDRGQILYDRFVQKMRSTLLPPELLDQLDRNGELLFQRTSEGAGDATGDACVPGVVLRRKVLNGTYGNRQALTLDSYGPMTHLFEF
jgi:D-tyrosyl-tRNA(Tyr) deacylase